jgi:hypothetical protein
MHNYINEINLGFRSSVLIFTTLVYLNGEMKTVIRGFEKPFEVTVQTQDDKVPRAASSLRVLVLEPHICI